MGENVDILLKLRGARQAAKEVKGVGREVGDLGDKSRRAARQTDALGKSAGRSRRSLRGIGKGAAVGAAGVAGLATVVGKTAFGAFQESRKEMAETKQLLKTTGGVANVSAGDVDLLTGSLMRKTAIDDEQIRQGANMLLTFKNVRNELGKGNQIFDRTTAAAVDLGAKMGSSTKGAAMQLGKALQDPTKGLTKLTRSGVDFTKAEQEKIKALQTSGDLLGAQKIMLAAVEGQTKGVAASRATPIDHMNVSLGELQETVGAKLAPTVDKGAKALTRFVGEIQTGKGAGGDFARSARDVWTETKPIVTWVGRAAVNVGRFAGKHPELTKLALAATAVGVGVNAIRTSRAVSGVNTLVTGLGRLSRTTAGQKMKESIFNGLSGLAGRVKSRLSGTRQTAVTTMQSVGTSAGTAGGNRMAGGFATTAGDRVKTSATSGKLAGSFKSAGRIVGPLMAVEAASKFGPKFQSALDELMGDSSPFKNAAGAAGSLLLAPMDPKGTVKRFKDFLDRRGGATGGLVTPGGIKGYGVGGLVPRGEDTLAGLRFGEFVMRKEAVDRMGLGAMRAMNQGVAPVPQLSDGVRVDNHLKLRIGRRDVAIAVAEEVDSQRQRR